MLRVDVPAALVRGDVAEGYGPVGDSFRRNFAERGEIGAACAVYREGRKVVDLWGGYRDGETRAEWREDTIVVMFSTTKGVSSLALALAHTRGLFDYEQPVAAHWPEFASLGRGEVSVRQLLSHQAGLPVLEIPLTIADPDTGFGYCYAPNRLGFGLLDEREIALRDALYHDVLGERPQRP